MRTLVTGGAGFIGSALARRLLEEGHDVVVADDLSTGCRENVPPQAELVVVDLGKKDSLSVLKGREFDVICHLAGQSSGAKSFDDPVRDFDANARSTAILCSWALASGVNAFVHASSMSVYADPQRLPIAEAAPTVPVSYYGASKLAAERVLSLAASQGLRTVSLRMFSVYGRGQDLTELRQGIVSIYLAYMLKGREIPVTGSLDRVRDLVHVDDVVDVWERAIEKPVRGAFNVGTGVGTRVRDLIARLSAALGLEGHYPVRECEISPGDQSAVCADIGRAVRELGWEPKISLDEGLRSTVAWAREPDRPANRLVGSS